MTSDFIPDSGSDPTIRERLLRQPAMKSFIRQLRRKESSLLAAYALTCLLSCTLFYSLQSLRIGLVEE